MTNNTYYNTILPLVQDLDENIISNVTVDNENGLTTTITFNNPVTGSTDRAIFEGRPLDIQGIYYVIDYSDERTNEELIMEDLNDLYDFILIDEDHTPTEGQGLSHNHTTAEDLSSVTDMWADQPGGSTMTI